MEESPLLSLNVHIPFVHLQATVNAKVETSNLFVSNTVFMALPW